MPNWYRWNMSHLNVSWGYIQIYRSRHAPPKRFLHVHGAPLNRRGSEDALVVALQSPAGGMRQAGAIPLWNVTGMWVFCMVFWMIFGCWLDSLCMFVCSLVMLAGCASWGSSTTCYMAPAHKTIRHQDRSEKTNRKRIFRHSLLSLCFSNSRVCFCSSLHVLVFESI